MSSSKSAGERARRQSERKARPAAAKSKLAARWLVERAPDPVDSRRNVVTITPAGTAWLRQLDALLGDVTSIRRCAAIVNEVGGDQGAWDEKELEDEVADEAVSLAAGDGSRPERQGYPAGEKTTPRSTQPTLDTA